MATASRPGTIYIDTTTKDGNFSIQWKHFRAIAITSMNDGGVTRILYYYKY